MTHNVTMIVQKRIIQFKILSAPVLQHPDNCVASNSRNSFFTVLETGSPNTRSQQGHAPSEGSRGESVFASCSFWQFPAFLGLW